MHVYKQFHILGGCIDGRHIEIEDWTGFGEGDWIKKLACQMKHKKRVPSFAIGTWSLLIVQRLKIFFFSRSGKDFSDIVTGYAEIIPYFCIMPT